MVTFITFWKMFFRNNVVVSEFWKRHSSCKFTCQFLFSFLFWARFHFQLFDSAGENYSTSRPNSILTTHHFQRIDQVVLIGAKNKHKITRLVMTNKPPDLYTKRKRKRQRKRERGWRTKQTMNRRFHCFLSSTICLHFVVRPVSDLKLTYTWFRISSFTPTK